MDLLWNVIRSVWEFCSESCLMVFKNILDRYDVIWFYFKLFLVNSFNVYINSCLNKRIGEK